MNLRYELNQQKFDWESGRIIYQTPENKGDTMFSKYKKVEFLEKDSTILDEEFENEFGGCTYPPIIVEDKDFIYFVVVYDGRGNLEKISKNIEKYLTSPIPFFGN